MFADDSLFHRDERRWTDVGVRRLGQLLADKFVQGMYPLCVYCHKEKTLVCIMNGDDYVGIGNRCDVEWCFQRAKERFIVKERGVL